MTSRRVIRLCAGLLTTVVATTVMAQPATLTQSVTHNGETFTMQLTKVDLRGPNFELWEQNAAGGYDVVTPVAERSYLGTVVEDPAAVSCGVLLDNGQFKGTIYFDRGLTWFTLEDGVTSTRGVTHAVDVFTDFELPTAPTVAGGTSGTNTYRFDVGVDGSHDYYVDRGSSVAGCLELIEYSVNNTRAIYMRDVMLRPALGRVIIRANATQDPYGGFMELDPLRIHWQNNQGSADRDVVCGVQPAFGGGLAWVSQVGTSFAYSMNGTTAGAFDVVWRHEVGHNWGCGHFVGGSPEGAGLMGGNQPGRLTGCEVHRVFEYRDNRIAAGGILSNEGTFTAVDLPPYAALDVPPSDVTEGETVTLDVLGNDFDANGHALALLSFDASSSLGGALALSAGTGPGGRDEVIYTSPPASAGIDDFFLYQIQDSTGQTATGAVIIRSLDAPPLPTITSVAPSVGPTTGGTPVTIVGTDFASDTTVLFGANSLENFNLVDATTITGTTPASAGPMTVDVSVSNAFNSDTLPDAFHYTDNHFGILSASGAPGSTATVAAMLSHDQPLEGYSLAATYETSFLDVTAVTVDGTAAATADFVGPNFSDAEGWFTLGVIMNFSPPVTPIPAGDNQELAFVTIEVDSAAPVGSFYAITPQSGVGDPAVDNVFVILGGVGAPPSTSGGIVQVIAGATFIRGDVNEDSVVDIADPVAALDFLFSGGTVNCLDAADANDDGAVDIADPIYELDFLFSGGPPPPAPHPNAGSDPTADSIGC